MPPGGASAPGPARVLQARDLAIYGGARRVRGAVPRRRRVHCHMTKCGLRNPSRFFFFFFLWCFSREGFCVDELINPIEPLWGTGDVG